jgi:hypothetical protein
VLLVLASSLAPLRGAREKGQGGVHVALLLAVSAVGPFKGLLYMATLLSMRSWASSASYFTMLLRTRINGIAPLLVRITAVDDIRCGRGMRRRAGVGLKNNEQHF